MAMTCPHPDYALEHRSERAPSPAKPEVKSAPDRWGNSYVVSYARPAYAGHAESMWCSECKEEVCRVRGEQDYVQAREAKWRADHPGEQFCVRDMFGTPIVKGSKVVYPSLSGRSATLSFGEVVDINHTKNVDLHEMARRPRVDAPDRIKILPYDYTSRWKNWSAGPDKKTVNLTANAPSVVVILNA